MINMIKETIDALTSFHPVKKFSNVFLLEKISQKKSDNIRSTYGKDIKPDEEILLILDDTLFGKADNGFAITENGVYFNLTDPTGGFKRRQDKISMDFIFDPNLSGLKIDVESDKSGSPKYLTFNGMRLGKYVLCDKIEIAFLNELFEAFNKLKQEVIVEEGKGKNSKANTKGTPNHAKISPDSQFLYLPNGDQYFGEVISEKMNGYGIYYYNTASTLERYEGNWKEGIYNGQGSLIFKSKERYDGEWKDNQRDGKGTNIWPDGMQYKGEWKKNKRSGSGILTWPNGTRHEGKWDDDKRCGKGIQTWPDGRQYDGNWKEDAFNGQGTLTLKSGENYEGEWKDDKRSGKGISIQSDGKRYEGEWRDDGINGKGICIYSNGQKYEGEWENANQHGSGTLYDKKGIIIYQGQWENGIFIGAYEGSLTDENGTYTGQVDNQKKNGKGLLKYSKQKDGLFKFEGEWKNDKTIKGTYFFEGGSSISGTFSDDYSSGKGTITQHDGVTFEGSWENLQLPHVVDNNISLFMIPDLNSIIFAQEFVKDEFQGKFIFETQQIGDKLNIKSIDNDLDYLLKDEQCDKALQTIEGVRKKISQQQETDDKIHSHLNMREDAVKKLKNEILHRDIMSKFGGSIDPKPEIPKQEKPKDDFDDFA